MSQETAGGITQSDAQVGGRRRFKYKAETTELVTDGYMSLRDAQDVLISTLTQWGIASQRDDDIDPVVGKIAHALRQGTSSERDMDKVWFDHGGTRCYMSVLKLEASKRDTSENPVRVFARSYNHAEIPMRIYDMLKDPENVSLREEAALDYECSVDVVHLSFDCADALVKFKDFKFAQVERYVVKYNTLSKVRASRSTHLGSTNGGSIQDSAAHAAAVESAVPVSVGGVAAGINPAGAGKRANFASIR